MAGETILVVEDEPLVGVELQEWLTDLGYSIPEVVEDGAQVAQAALKHQPDLILMDVRIRGSIDGVEAASQVRQNSDVPIIFLTAYSDPSTVARIAGVSPDGYLLKPFREKELEANVAMALQKRRNQGNESASRWRPLIDLMEQPIALYDSSGWWIYSNDEANESLPPKHRASLPEILGISPVEFLQNPEVWVGKEISIGEAGSSWVLSLDPLPDSKAGFLGFFHIMDKTERTHLQTSIHEIQADLNQWLPTSHQYSDRLAIDGFLVPRPSGTGDFYDLFPLGPHHFVFYNLDVSGHGILSSLLVTSIRGMVRALAGSALVKTGNIPSVTELLQSLNQRYLALHPDGPFFTITLGILTPSSGELRISRAGHPGPWVSSPGGAVRELVANGPALGVFDEVLLSEGEDRLRPGERIVLVSDGVLERLGSRDLDQGRQVLRGLLAQQPNLSDLIRDVKDWCLKPTDQPADDLSFFVIEPKLW